MSRLHLSTNNLVATASVSSNELPDTSINNVLNEWKSRTTIWPAPTTEVLQIVDLAVASDITYAAWVGGNVTGATLMRVELYSGSSPSFVLEYRPDWTEWQVTGDATRPDVFVFWFNQTYSNITRITFRVDCSTLETTDGTSDLDLRMCMAGEHVQLDCNFEYGAALSYLTPPELVQTYSGTNIPTRSQIESRALQLPLSTMCDADRRSVSALERSLSGAPFIVDAYPTGSDWERNDHLFLARFSSALSYEHVFLNLYGTTLNLVEV